MFARRPRTHPPRHVRPSARGLNTPGHPWLPSFAGHQPTGPSTVQAEYPQSVHRAGKSAQQGVARFVMGLGAGRRPGCACAKRRGKAVGGTEGSSGGAGEVRRVAASLVDSVGEFGHARPPIRSRTHPPVPRLPARSPAPSFFARPLFRPAPRTHAAGTHAGMNARTYVGHAHLHKHMPRTRTRLFARSPTRSIRSPRSPAHTSARSVRSPARVPCPPALICPPLTHMPTCSPAR